MRKSKREIEREVENMDSTEEPPQILFLTETEEGDRVTLDGDPVLKATVERAGIIFTCTSPDEKGEMDA
jgi:hypothetical protein